jgi:hypothetical protein
VSSQQVIWSPQPGPQTALISCPVFEVFFGGARGGGKTEGSIGDWLDHSNTYGEAANGIFLRRKFKQLEEVVARTKQIFPHLGAKYNETKAEWTMPSKARLKFRYIERDQDAEEYQGHSYTRAYFEEVPNFPTPAPINLIRATLRSAAGVPCGMRLTGNPGGPGHHWVKKRYIEPAPGGYEVIKEPFLMPDGSTQYMERIFIPSKIADNVLLMRNDPTYIMRLMQSGSAALVKAWLEGNWDVIDGAFFDCWDEERHVLSTSEWLPKIPQWSVKFRAMDWGSQKPFCVGWYAVSDGTWGLPKDALLKYREWYGSDGKPNIGLKMEAASVARGILALDGLDTIHYGAADPSIFVRDGGPSIAEMMFQTGLMWRKADNKRVPGWEQLRHRLVGQPGRMVNKEGQPIPVPMLYVLDTCLDTIRTLPVLQHDDTKVEDVDTDSEDHAADETRYAVMSRPWTISETKPQDFSLPNEPQRFTISELVEERTRRRRQMEQDQ